MPVRHLKARQAALSLAVVLAGFRYSSASTNDSYLGLDNGLWSDPVNWSAGVPFNTPNQTFNVDMTSGWLTVQLDTSTTIDTLAIGVADTLHLLPNSVLTFASASLINHGTLFLDNASTAQLLLKTDTQLSGGGYVILSGANNRIDTLSSARLISDNSIFGEGAIGTTGGTLLKFVNLGSVTATTGRLAINANPNSTITDSCINMGTFAADGGILVLTGAVINNVSGLVEARASSIVTVNSGVTLLGGILRSTGGGTVTLGSGSSSLTLSGTFLSGIVQTATTSAAILLGSLSNAGTLSCQSGSLSFGSPNTTLQVAMNNTGLIQAGSASTLQVYADTILSGGGTLSLDGNVFNAGGASAPFRLTSDNVISGRGTLGASSSIGTSFTNNGTISATTGLLSLLCSSFFNSTNPVNNINTGTLRADGGTLAIVGPANASIQFANTGGTIEALANSLVTITNSTIVGGTIRSVGGGTVSLTGGANTLNGIALQGLVQLQPGVTLSFTGFNSNAGTLVLAGGTAYFGPSSASAAPPTVTLNNAGLVQVGQTAGSSTLVFTADTNVTGGGSIALTGNLYNSQSGGYPVRLTSDNYIFGRGTLGSAAGYGTYFTNNGTIAATTGTLNLVTGIINGSNLQNSYNAGFLRADGGTLVLSGAAPLYNTAGIIEAADNSLVALNGTAIVGGTIRSLGSGTVTAYGTLNGTLSGLTFAGLIQTLNVGTTYLLGQLTNTGTLVLGGTTNFGPTGSSSTAPPAVSLKNTGLILIGQTGSTAAISLTADTALSGGGSVTLNGNAYTFSGPSYTMRFTSDNVIIGRGTLGTTSGPGTYFTNTGTIAASGGILNLVTGFYTGQGTIQYSYNSGILRAMMGPAGGTGGPTGGTLALTGTVALINTGGIIEASASSLVTISGIAVSGGTIRSVGGGTVTLFGALVDATLGGLVQTTTSTTNFTGRLANAGTLILSGTDYFGPTTYQGVPPPVVTLNNTGLIQAGSTGGPTVILLISANTTLSGGGSLVLNNNVNNNVSGYTPRLTTDNYISGRGVLGTNSPYGPSITNTGTIAATTGLLTLNTIPSNSPTTPLNYNTGMLRAEGGTLVITGLIGFNNTGGIVEAAANSLVNLSTTNISGGIVRSVGGGTVTLSGGTLTNVEMGGVLQMPNGAAGILVGTLKNDGALSLLGGASSTSQLNISAPSGFTILNNTGQIQFGARLNVNLFSDFLLTGAGSVSFSGNTTLLPAGAVRMTSDNFFSGAGTIGASNFRLTNSGTISATSSAFTLLTDSTIANNFLNLGTLRADGGTLILTGGSITNSNGVIEAIHSSKVSLRTLVSGGMLRMVSGGVLALDTGSSIAPDAALSFEGGILQFTNLNAADYSTRFRTTPGQAFNIDTNAMNVTFASPLHSAGGTFTKLGAGILTLTGASDFSGLATLSAGTLQIGAGGDNGSLANTPIAIANAATLTVNRTGLLSFSGAITGTGTFNKSGAGTATLASYQATGPLTLTAGKLAFAPTAAPRHTPAVLLQSSALSLTQATQATTLDLSNHDLLIHSGSTSTFESQIASAYNFGLWTKPGITSSTAQANPITTLAILSGTDYNTFSPTPGTFDNTPVLNSDTVIKFTYVGDLNLDGLVNDDDLFIFNGAYFFGGTGNYALGDLNFDALVNDDDLFLFNGNYFFPPASPLDSLADISLASPSNPAISAPVPESATLLLLAFGFTGLLARRKPRASMPHTTRTMSRLAPPFQPFYTNRLH